MNRAAKLSATLSACAAAFALTSCGSDDTGTTPGTAATESGTPAASSTPTQEATPSSDAAEPIKVTFKGDTVSPAGDRVTVKAGEEIAFDITADKPGEIHVHSSPEQEFEYDAGNSTKTLIIDRPGVVEVESHTLEKVIVQLEVK